jgi:hypothetical protein
MLVSLEAQTAPIDSTGIIPFSGEITLSGGFGAEGNRPSDETCKICPPGAVFRLLFAQQPVVELDF